MHSFFKIKTVKTAYRRKMSLYSFYLKELLDGPLTPNFEVTANSTTNL